LDLFVDEKNRAINAKTISKQHALVLQLMIINHLHLLH